MPDCDCPSSSQIALNATYSSGDNITLSCRSRDTASGGGASHFGSDPARRSLDHHIFDRHCAAGDLADFGHAVDRDPVVAPLRNGGQRDPEARSHSDRAAAFCG